MPLVLILGTCALCALGVRRIGLDASFEALLPRSTPSVQARDEVRARLGASDLYVIAVRSPDPSANHRFAGALKEGIESWPETAWVMDRIDLDVFRERALLYMPVEDLRELVDLVELQVGRGLCRARGDCAESDLRSAGEVERDERRLRELGRAHEDRLADTAGDRRELAARHPELRDALMSPDGTVAVVMGRLTVGTTNIERAREMMLRGEELVAEIGPERFHPELEARVVGAYRSLNEYDTVLEDATTASLVSLSLVAILIVAFFRSFRAVAFVGGSLVVGLVWTAGLVGVTVPTFNTVTAVIFGILLGMGIDYPIHLAMATRAARREGAELPEALASAMRRTVPAMVTSALTTASALLTLLAAQNRGFREFGIIGSFGIVLCLVSAVVVTPPLTGLVERLSRSEGRLWMPSDRWLARSAPLLALVTMAVLCGLLAWRAPRLPFEYNLSNLSAPSTGAGIRYGAALRTGRGTTPVVLLGDDVEQLRLAHRELVERRESGDERILDVVTIETFIPPDQEQKLDELERLADVLNPRVLRRVDEEMRPDLERLARLAEVDEPIGLDDLPGWARRSLTERDGTVGEIGYVYMLGRHEDARDAMAFQREYGRIDVGRGRPIRAANARFVIADVVHTMIADGRRMALVAVIAIIVLLALDLRSLSGVLLSVLVLGLGILWAFGAAEWLGWKLGVFNMLVIPVALGLGIDGAVHVYHRYRRDPTAFQTSPLGATGFAVFASSVTTIAGFTGLLFVAHRGLSTIGQLAVLAVAMTMIGVLAVLPGGLLVVARRKRRD